MTADVYTEGSNNLYALCFVLVDSTTGAYKRLFFDAQTGYTNTATTVTLAVDESATYDKVRVVWSSSSTMGSYTQTGNNPNGNAVHQNLSGRPPVLSLQMR